MRLEDQTSYPLKKSGYSGYEDSVCVIVFIHFALSDVPKRDVVYFSIN